VKQTTKQLHLAATVQAQHFTLLGHTARMSDETDAKILTTSPWRTGGDQRDAPIDPYYMDEDYPAGPKIQ